MTQEERDDKICEADVALKKQHTELLKAQTRRTNAEATAIEDKLKPTTNTRVAGN